MKFKGTAWPPVNPKDKTLKYFHLDSNRPQIIDEPFSDRIALWQRLNLKNSL
jgi:hypothetical protein